MAGKHEGWPVITVTLPPRWWELVKKLARHNACTDREQFRLLVKAGLVQAGQLGDRPVDDNEAAGGAL